MKLTKIKVGYLISYDFEYFFTSVKYVYKFVDEIFLAIDKEGLTWSGTPFKIADDFFIRLNKLDVDNKIKIYRDIFYKPELTPIQLDTREREMLNVKMGRGWKIQLDSDEYIYDFQKIAQYFKKYWYFTVFPSQTPLMLQGRLISMIKGDESGFYYVDNNEPFVFATNQNQFSTARLNYNIRNFNINAICVHQSWARTKPELQFKINNWGHVNDFDKEGYLYLWDSIGYTNYKEFKNFHPTSPLAWPKIQFMPAKSIEDFISVFEKTRRQKLKPIPLRTIFGAGFRKAIRLLRKK